MAESSEVAPFKVTVQRLRVATDYPLEVFEVELSKKGEAWVEDLPTTDTLKAFIRGMKAASALLGHYLPEPEIPREPSKTFSEEEPEVQFSPD